MFVFVENEQDIMVITNNYCTILIISLILRESGNFLRGRMRFKKIQSQFC